MIQKINKIQINQKHKNLNKIIPFILLKLNTALKHFKNHLISSNLLNQKESQQIKVIKQGVCCRN